MSSNSRTESVRVRATAEETAWLKEQAASQGVTVSDYVRARVFTTVSNFTVVTGDSKNVSAGAPVSGPLRTGNSALYASATDVDVLNQRLSSLENKLGVDSAGAALEQAQAALAAKPKRKRRS